MTWHPGLPAGATELHEGTLQEMLAIAPAGRPGWERLDHPTTVFKPPDATVFRQVVVHEIVKVLAVADLLPAGTLGKPWSSLDPLTFGKLKAEDIPDLSSNVLPTSVIMPTEEQM
jgi:hypothetical protein